MSNRVMRIEIDDPNVSNVRYRIVFPMRTASPDPDDIVGRVPWFVGQMWPALMAAAMPGEYGVYEVTDRGDTQGVDVVGDVVIHSEGDMEWNPKGGSISPGD